MNARQVWMCLAFLLLAASVCTVTAQEKPPATANQSADAQATAVEEHPASRPSFAQRYPRYLLRPSDILQISFPLTPEFDQTVPVQPDGFITLRGVGDLHAEGKTVPELAEALKSVYGKFLHDPVINIELKDFEKPYFIAGGELGRPGKYELRGDTTVAEAVEIAGGFTDRAKHSEVLLFRRVPEGWMEARRLDIKKMLAHRDLSEDMHLRPGDMVYVPKNRLSKIRQFIPNTAVGLSMSPIVP